MMRLIILYFLLNINYLHATNCISSIDSTSFKVTFSVNGKKISNENYRLILFDSIKGKVTYPEKIKVNFDTAFFTKPKSFSYGYLFIIFKGHTLRFGNIHIYKYNALIDIGIISDIKKLKAIKKNNFKNYETANLYYYHPGNKTIFLPGFKSLRETDKIKFIYYLIESGRFSSESYAADYVTER